MPELQSKKWELFQGNLQHVIVIILKDVQLGDMVSIAEVFEYSEELPG